MTSAAQSMKTARGIAFGYLGGWTRISAAERSIDTSGRLSEDLPGQPLPILPVAVKSSNVGCC